MEESLFRSNYLFKTIRNFQDLFPDEFAKCDIKPCGHCNGTGIVNKASLEMCNVCGGIGYRGFVKIRDQFVCRSCNGSGCSKCMDAGVVDWVSHANGKDMPEKPWGLKK